MAERRNRRTSGATRSTGKGSGGDIIDVTFDDYEPPRAEYMGEEPRKGVYRFKLANVARHTSGEGNESIRWIFECADEPYTGWAGFMYTGLPGSESWFRTQNNVRALQGGAEKAVKLNLDDPSKFIKAAKVVLGKVVMEEYNGDLRAKLRTVVPDDGTVKSTRPPADDDEYEDDEYEDAPEDDDEDLDEDDADEDADDADDDDEDEDEDDDEPEPEPAPRRRAKKTAPAARTRRTRR